MIVLEKSQMERPADSSGLTTTDTRGAKRRTGVPAFKEWAIVCDSIARGETSLIFRKGGIAEGGDGFRFKHQRVFLFPTYFHGQIERTRLSPERDLKPQRDPVVISVFVQIEIMTLVRDLALLRSLEPFHVLQMSVLEERFRYDDREGLHLAFVRAYRVSPGWEFPLHPSYGGCRSWVTIPEPPLDAQMETVLSDEEKSRRRSLVSSFLSPK